MTEISAAQIEHLTGSFSLMEERLNGDSKLFLHQKRKEALAAFQQTGLPTLKNEEWKYTNLAHIPLAELNFEPQQAIDVEFKQIEYCTFPEIKTNKLIFINGKLSQQLSEIKEQNKSIIIGSFANQSKHHPHLVEQYFGRLSETYRESVAKLNMAFVHDGAFIHVPKGKRLQHPVLILNLLDSFDPDAITQPRNLIMLEDGARASIIESHRGLSPVQMGVSNSVSEIFLGKSAHLDCYKLQLTKHLGTFIDSTYASQQRDSVFHNYRVNFGASLVRNNLKARLNEPNCEADLKGVYITSDGDHVDNHILVEHAAPHCYSTQLYKGILDGKSTGVFNGKILVFQEAQKTNAFQSNKNVLLSDHATINSKPQLEIYADDVKCSHGATSGKLDDNAIFYLMSRGLDKQRATAMITQAFASEALKTIEIPELKESLLQQVANRLNVEF